MDTTREIALEATETVLAHSRQAISHARELAGKITNANHSQALLLVSELFENALEPFKKSTLDSLQLLEVWDAKLQVVKSRNGALALANREKLADLKVMMENYRRVLSEIKAKKKPPKSLKKRIPKTEPIKPPSLLPPQELRDQIARKIERPPAPPQTTGNIWENWGKPQQTPPPSPAGEENKP
jgi:hypothetical protein